MRAIDARTRGRAPHGARAMAASRRRSYEPGHRPNTLVVIDDTPECSRAVRYAIRRTARTGAGLVFLGVVPPPDGPRLLGVAEAIEAEARAEIEERIGGFVQLARALTGLEAEHVVRTGDKADEIVAAIEEDEDISILVLAAGVSGEGPGPLVSALARGAIFPIPVTIVPGGLADEEIDALA